MSFLDDIGSGISSLVSDVAPIASAAANFVTPGLGSAISGGLGFLGSMQTNATNASNAQAANAFNAQQAQINRDYQTEMSNTAYQRQVADMQAAGLNPMLAYMKGGGASSPSGSTASATVPQYQSPIQGAAQYKLTSAQASKTEAEKPQVEASTAMTNQQINNLQTENEKAKAVIDNLKQEYQNLIKQGYNLTEVGNQLREDISLKSKQIANFAAITENQYVITEIKKLEQRLTQYDVDAATDTGNLGREYHQVKGLLDVFRALTRR